MIEHLEVTDFKAFHHASLDFAPLTILVGPNNSGKSSILAPMRLLAQTLQSAETNIPLLLDGPLGDFGTFRDIVHGNHRGRPMRISLVASDRPAGVRDVDLDDTVTSTVGIDLEFKYRTGRRELVLRQVSLTYDGSDLGTFALSSDSERHVAQRLHGVSIPPPLRSSVSDNFRMYNFMPRFWPVRRARTDVFEALLDIDPDALLDKYEQAFIELYSSLQSIDYVSAMRQPPERTYHQTGAARTAIGRGGENWAGLFVLDSARGARSRTIEPGLTKWLRDAGLASSIKLNWLSDRHYEVQLQHPVTGEYQNLADVGQANSQVIPVIVGGLRLRPGATYLVEEPEIHLHPGAQAELADFFIDLMKSGVQSLVETHSEYLILRLQQHVASGDLLPSEVKFYYVAPVDDQKVVRALDLDASGRFLQPLDGGFFPQRLDEARRLAAIRGGIPVK